MTVFVAFHKSFPLLSNDQVYQPLHVGKSLSNKELGFIGDSGGDQISNKNPNYSELTGLYWIWKNTTTEFVGLSHYRRYFFMKPPTFSMKFKKVMEFLSGQGRKRHGTFYTSNKENANLILTGAEVQEIMKKYDAIVAVGSPMKYNVKEQYRRRHLLKDLLATEKILSELYPNYLPAFQQVMKSNSFHPCNMFVMKRDNFNNYMQWLFSILFELEKQSDVTGYDNYQKRLFGFVSERLMDVWLIHNKLNTISLPVLYFKKLKE